MFKFIKYFICGDLRKIYTSTPLYDWDDCEYNLNQYGALRPYTHEGRVAFNEMLSKRKG